MDAEFWLDVWKSNDLPFHRSSVSSDLIRFFPRLELKKGEQIFIPLCGKSKDLLWFAEQDLRFIGVELSPIAVNSFFEESELVFETKPEKKFVRYSNSNIEILNGDFFDLRSEHLEKVSAVYDRAAIVALPPEMRRKYADHLRSILPRKVRILMFSFEYNDPEFKGPPFSVPETEIRELFGRDFEIELLKKSFRDKPAVGIHKNKILEAGAMKEFDLLLVRK